MLVFVLVGSEFKPGQSGEGEVWVRSSAELETAELETAEVPDVGVTN